MARDTELVQARDRGKRKAIDADLSQALDDAKVKSPKARKMAGLLIRNAGIDARENGDNWETFVKGKDGEIPLSEFVSQWADTDEGKDFVVTPDNSGAHDDSFGGGGGKRVPDTKGMTGAQKLGTVYGETKPA